MSLAMPFGSMAMAIVAASTKEPGSMSPRGNRRTRRCPRIAIPYTFVLDAERVIHKIYNGWWYVGRPTVEERRMDLRALMARRRDWWYDDMPAPYAQVVKGDKGE